MGFKTTRVDESRALVWDALQMAFGSYVEQEGKKADTWRDQSLGQLGDHIRHEVDEVMSNLRRSEIGFLMHNAMDVIELVRSFPPKPSSRLVWT
ncbi:MAG: hypothetical protein Q8R28_08075 [Dehalococcoidia bacterium]|nr:hypothetical protein [Dehalococcoidia bacterium]